MKRIWFIGIGCLVFAGGVLAGARPLEMEVESLKQRSLDQLRLAYAKAEFRGGKQTVKKTPEECAELLGEDGVFSDLREEEAVILEGKMDQSAVVEVQARVSGLTTEAFNRLWKISETFRNQTEIAGDRATLREKVFAGFIHYAAIEDGRLLVGKGRFHPSCFAIPTAAVNSYFCFFNDMQRVETGEETDPLFVQANQAVKTMGYQAWTQPVRNDETDQNVVSAERFRKHVWWVGSNAMPFRPLLGAAIMMNSIPMMDVVAEISKKAISVVSQTTYDDAFWMEGLTADGSGWGHGMQGCLWGYPRGGVQGALSYLEELDGSAWEQELERERLDVLMRYIRYSPFYYYKGYLPPCLSRVDMRYDGGRTVRIPSLDLAKIMQKNYDKQWMPAEREELKQFISEAHEKRIRMEGYPSGHYTGSRYFYNNDDLIVKSDDFYFLINMASIRCDGVESAVFAAEYNFYTCDGQTLFLRRGDEAKQTFGGINLTAFPGVTARQGEDRLVPTMNWKGFCSKYNFAAGATRGEKNACAGFIFEKMNASAKPGVNDTIGLENPTTVIYGVRAYKSWFVFDDMLLALGAGVSNLEPDQPGDIWTTIDQTLWQGSVVSEGWKMAHDGLDYEKLLKRRSSTVDVIPWVKQEGGFVYAVLPDQTPGEVSLALERRASKWEKIAADNRRKKNLPQTADILELRISHGHDAIDDTYGYMVYAGQKDPAEVFAAPPVTVLSNTTQVQAAASSCGRVVQAVFYDAQAVLVAGERTFSVSAPCAFMAEFEDNEVVHVTVTDARMNTDLNDIVVKIDQQEVAIPLPVEPHRGKPATLDLQWRPL